MIAPVVERSPENCRQILKRARDRILSDQGRYETPSEQNQRMVQLFQEAVTTGELESLLDVLSADAVLVRDGGDLFRPAPPPVSGATLGLELRKALGPWAARSAKLLSGQIAEKHLLLAENNGRPVGALLFQLEQEQVRFIRIVTCPAILRHLRLFLACQTSKSMNN